VTAPDDALSRARGNLVRRSAPAEVAPSEPAAGLSVGGAIIRHLVLFIVVVLVGVVVGGALAGVEKPVYKAEAKLIVGKTVNLANLADVAGLASAGNQIAADYARLTGTPAFEQGVIKRLGHTPGGSITATPVSGSPTLLIDATGPSSAAAQALATAGSGAMVDAVNLVNQQTTAANDSLVAAFQAASTTLEQDQQKATQLQAQIASLQGAIGSRPATAEQTQTLASLNQQLVATLAAVDTDKLKTSTLQSQYQSAVSPSTTFSQVLTPLGSAVPTGDNRKSSLEIGLIGGAVGGVIVAAAVATALEASRGRRRRRHGTPAGA
jgi:hypothetical protein